MPYSRVIFGTERARCCFAYGSGNRVEPVLHDFGLANRVAKFHYLAPYALDFVGTRHERICHRHQLVAKSTGKLAVIAPDVLCHHQRDIMAMRDKSC